MTQTEPLTITLSVTGLSLGYTVLNIDRTQYAAFTTTGMAEVGSSGVYAVAGGVVVPDAGGYIQVYKAPAGTEFVGEAAVRSTSANVTQVKGTALTESSAGRLAAALSTLLDVATPVLTAASVNQSGDAYARLGAPTGASVSADVAALGKLLSDLPSAGAGAIAHTITVDDGTNPLDGAEVWISTDEAGSNVVAGTLSTDALGRVTFMLDAGTYWKHVQLAGYNFTAKAFTVA